MTENGQSYIDRLRKIREKYGCMISNSKSLCPSQVQSTDKRQTSRNQTQTIQQSVNNYFKMDPSFHRINRVKQMEIMRKQCAIGTSLKDIGYHADQLQRSINLNQQRFGVIQSSNITKHHAPSFNPTPTKNTDHFDKITSYGAALVKDQQNRLTIDFKDRFSMRAPVRNNRFQMNGQMQNIQPRDYSQLGTYQRETRNFRENRFSSNAKDQYPSERTIHTSLSRKPLQGSHPYNQIVLDDRSNKKTNQNQKQFYEYSLKNQGPRRKVFSGVGNHGNSANSIKQNSNDMIKTIRNTQNKSGQWTIENFDRIQRKIQGVLNQRF